VRWLVAAGLLIALRTERVDAQRQPGWEVRLPERIEATVGGTVPLPIAIAVDRGLVVSKDAQVIVDLAPEDGVSTKKHRLGRADAVDPEADAPRFAPQIRVDAEGDHVVKVRLRMWICGGKACKPLDLRRQTVIAARHQTP
jgi:hypothetical protein